MPDVPRRSRRQLGRLVILATALAMGACSSSNTTASEPSADIAADGTINVYAATSLSAVFNELADQFEDRYPDAIVNLNVNSSSTLAAQIEQGAPADVFASADLANMDRLVAAALTAGDPQVFTKNTMQIAVGKGNPKGVTAVTDLARDDLTVILCAEAVPCGNYARQVLTKASVAVNAKSNEQNVGALIGRISSGEADAGIAYVTDVLANNEVDGVVIPADLNVVAEYPLAVLEDAPNATTAEAFVTFIQSTDAQSVFAKYGFLPL